MKKSASGLAVLRATAAPARTPSKMGAQTGSFSLFLSNAKPMVGVCEHATAPMILATV